MVLGPNGKFTSWFNVHAQPWWGVQTRTAWSPSQELMYTPRGKTTPVHVKFRANQNMNPVFIKPDSDEKKFIDANVAIMLLCDPPSGHSEYILIPRRQIKWTDFKAARDRSRSRDRKAGK